MNPITKKDDDGVFYECSIDGQWFDDKIQAQNCCSNKIAKSDPNTGRIKNSNKQKVETKKEVLPYADVLFGIENVLKNKA